MKKKELVLYQDVFCDKVIAKIGAGIKRIVCQLATGGGKTVIFSAITNRFIKKYTEKHRVFIVVHRDELLSQTRQTLYDWYEIISSPIQASVKKVSMAEVHVAMVETLHNRIKKPDFKPIIKDVGMVVIDEAHIGNFKKLFPLFPDDIILLGFTATPLATSKKDPMKNHYTDIVCGPQIRELIALNKIYPDRYLVQNRTYSIKNINRGNLRIKNGEFEEAFMGNEFSKKKQVQNTIDAYIKFGIHQKTLVFNANVKHSKTVNQAFIAAGFNSRHLDGENIPLGPHIDEEGILQPAEYDWLPDGWKGDYDSWRKDCFKWLRETPDAILNNVGIATTGFDDPSIINIIVNSAMMSMPLWLQKCGRGARPFMFLDGTFKMFFNIIDLGGNAITHGDWCDDRDWEFIFFNPKKAGNGVAPVKDCPQCDFINPASARKCHGFIQDDLFGEIPCGYIYPVKAAEFDEEEKEFVMITKGIDVQKTISFFADRSEWFSLFEMIKHIATYARQTHDYNELTKKDMEDIFDNAYLKVKEWCKLKGKRNNGWYKKTTMSKIMEELIKLGFVLPKEEIIFEL